MNDTLSIIIPTLNEEDGIAKVICSIPKEIRENSELIVIDVSDDLTGVIAGKLGAKVLKETKKGKGWQMRQAVLQSKGDILIFLDGDGQHSGAHIPQMLKKLEKADLVIACRGLKKIEGEERVMIGEMFQLCMISYPASYILGMKFVDPISGFRAIRRQDWDKLNLKSANFEIEMEMDIEALKRDFIIEKVLIPKLRRHGGIHGSKFLKNPKMWFKIFKMVLDYKLKM